MTEEDWPHLLVWNADPEVLVWSDGIDQPRPEEETKEIYRSVSIFAHNFIVEYQGEPIGECWLQKMNLPDLIDRFPGRDLRRIDLVIGRKDLWGQGLGTDILRTLLRFAFEVERADGVFGMVEKYNPRSRARVRKGGIWGTVWVRGRELGAGRLEGMNGASQDGGITARSKAYLLHHEQSALAC